MTLVAADHLPLLLLALIVDALVGDPKALWSRVPHPVVLIGALIDGLDRRLNRPELPKRVRRAAGIVTVALVAAVAVAIGWTLDALFAALPWGWIGTVVVAAVLLAGRSLYDHVVAVACALWDGDLADARSAVARIVGRDVERLDQSGVARAAVETLAENFSDGLIAPAFWFAVFGLPGIVAYKAISTADSMIGHLSERHADFGWAAARLDDLVNLIPSRLAGALVALAAPLGGGRVRDALRVMLNDAAKHASPNAGWPEAAMAGAIDAALGGARSYDGITVESATLNGAGRRELAERDLRRALRVYLGAAAIFAVVVALLSVAVRLA